MTIDKLGVAKIKHLLRIHDLKSYRNACRVVRQLEPYTHQSYFDREKIIYLNKEGRALIGSTKEVKKSPLIQHSLLRNDAFVHFNCPMNWRTEHTLEVAHKPLSEFEIMIKGLTLKSKKVVADAVFERNGYMHIIEIDNTRNMIDNKKKIEAYREILPSLKVPILYFFTVNEGRKKKLQEWLYGIRHEILTFEEIR
ncbi:Replication-relaxation [Mesobacillus zeae]